MEGKNMISLTEKSIAAEFTGKAITALLPQWVRPISGSVNRYEVDIANDLADRKDLRETFGITEKLRNTWMRRGTEFSTFFTIEEGMIAACDISKYSSGEGARPSGGGPLKPTPQELRLVIRILKHLTQ
jgi:hypothetical protein